MSRFVFTTLLVLATAVHAQVSEPNQAARQQPTAEELAFARLPADIQQMLAGMTPAQGLQAVQHAQQHLIALGLPNPTPDQFRTALKALLGAPYSGSVGSASAGATTFPPLSPLVAPPPPLPR